MFVGRLRRHPLAESHDRGDYAVNLLRRSLLVRLDVSGRVALDNRRGEHPPQHGVAEVFDAAREHQFLEFARRGRHRAVSLTEWIAGHALVLEVDDCLRGVPAVVGRRTQVVVGRPAEDVGLDEVVVDDVAGRNGDVSIGNPAVVVDILAADLFEHLLLRYPEVRHELKAVVLVKQKYIGRDVGDVR